MPYVPVEKDRRKKGDQTKTRWVRVRVSPGERDKIRTLADQRGVTMSEMIRSFLFQEGDSET